MKILAVLPSLKHITPTPKDQQLHVASTNNIGPNNATTPPATPFPSNSRSFFHIIFPSTIKFPPFPTSLLTTLTCADKPICMGDPADENDGRM